MQCSFQITLFGSLHVEVSGIPITSVNTPRLQSLFAWLLLLGQTPQPRERLASALWPESSGPQARTNLRQLIHHLQHALPKHFNALKIDHAAIYWERNSDCFIDVSLFQNAMSAARQAKDAADWGREMIALTEATKLYTDDLLPSIYDPWLVPLRDNLRSELSVALHRSAILLCEDGKLQPAIACAEKLIAHDSLHESHYQLLFRLHVANQDRASAIRTYHQLKSALRREFGVQPGPDTMQLFEQILRSDQKRITADERAFPGTRSPHGFVGRTFELQRLEQAWSEALGGRSCALILSGEPGIGKTRLAEHLLQVVARQRRLVALAHCYSTAGKIAYAPVAEWIRSAPLRDTWSELSPFQRAEISRLVPEIQEAFPGMPHPSSESWKKVRLCEALNGAFAKLSEPILLFLDDLQWCDAESFEWLRQLFTSADARGILLLGTVRAEETDRNHPFNAFINDLHRKGLVSVIPLSPLDAAETERLASIVSAEPLHKGRLEAIVQSSKGNPLFVVEMVRSGLASTRVHAVISARLANLSALSYELAGFASIVGRPFSFELLEKASDWDDSSLAQALDELWQRRIIEGRGSAVYDFSHDRIREVVKAELTPVRTRYLHRRIARALMDLYRGEDHEWSGPIASHFEAAGMPKEAIQHMLVAARSARQRFAYLDAATLLRHAMSLQEQLAGSARDAEQELDILLLLGTVLVTTEGYSAEEVGSVYARALDLARPLGGTKYFTSLSGLWVYHVVRGEVEMSRQNALEFLHDADGQVSTDYILAGNFLLGSSLSHLGQFEASLRHLTIALEVQKTHFDPVLEVFGGPDVRVFCRAYLSHVAWHRAPNSTVEAADAFISEAIQSADQMQHPFIQAIALNYGAMLYALKGDSQSTLRVGSQAVELCNENKFAYYLAMANVLTGWAVAEQGNLVLGVRQFRGGIDCMRSLGAELRLPYFYALLAQTYSRAGLPHEAAASLSTGFAFASKNKE